MSIEYKINTAITPDQFVALLRETSLGVRRPIDDIECMTGMLANSNLLVTAWDGDLLVGVAPGLLMRGCVRHGCRGQAYMDVFTATPREQTWRPSRV